MLRLGLRIDGQPRVSAIIRHGELVSKSLEQDLAATWPIERRSNATPGEHRDTEHRDTHRNSGTPTYFRSPAGRNSGTPQRNSGTPRNSGRNSGRELRDTHLLPEIIGKPINRMELSATGRSRTQPRVSRRGSSRRRARGPNSGTPGPGGRTPGHPPTPEVRRVGEPNWPNRIGRARAQGVDHAVLRAWIQRLPRGRRGLKSRQIGRRRIAVKCASCNRGASSGRRVRPSAGERRRCP
jgi:hypothetical protein